MKEALVTLLASVAGGRCFWTRAPQGTPLPYVVMEQRSGLRDYAMSGPTGYVVSRVQADCYGATVADAVGTARALMATASGHASGNILGIFVDNEQDLPSADAGEVQHLFLTSVDLIVHYKEQ